MREEKKRASAKSHEEADIKIDSTVIHICRLDTNASNIIIRYSDRDTFIIGTLRKYEPYSN